MDQGIQLGSDPRRRLSWLRVAAVVLLGVAGTWVTVRGGIGSYRFVRETPASFVKALEQPRPKSRRFLEPATRGSNPGVGVGSGSAARAGGRSPRSGTPRGDGNVRQAGTSPVVHEALTSFQSDGQGQQPREIVPPIPEIQVRPEELPPPIQVPPDDPDGGNAHPLPEEADSLPPAPVLLPTDALPPNTDANPNPIADPAAPASVPSAFPETGAVPRIAAKPDPVAPGSGNKPNATSAPAAAKPGATSTATATGNDAQALEITELPLAQRLVAEQTVIPIDLPNALRLGGSRDLDIAIAREHIKMAMAQLEQARGLWLPSLFLGAQFLRSDGQTQLPTGQTLSISKNALMLGTIGASGAGASMPNPVGGPQRVNGLTGILRISDALYAPLAAQQEVSARQAGMQAKTNDQLLELTEIYLDLLNAGGKITITREAAASSARLVTHYQSQVQLDPDFAEDHRRSVAEHAYWRGESLRSLGELESASARLVRRLRLDPRVLVAPIEPCETVFTLVPPQVALDQLILVGLRHRPELREAQALVEATVARLKQAKLRPLTPSLAVSVSGGALAGGPNASLGTMDWRTDADIGLFWQLENLGVGDHARVKTRAAENRVKYLEWLKVQDRVAAEVAENYKGFLAAALRLQESSREMPAAYEALNKAMNRLGELHAGDAIQPIEQFARSRRAYLSAVTEYNRAQFRLHRAMGQPPQLPGPPPAASATATTPAVTGRDRDDAERSKPKSALSGPATESDGHKPAGTLVPATSPTPIPTRSLPPDPLGNMPGSNSRALDQSYPDAVSVRGAMRLQVPQRANPSETRRVPDPASNPLPSANPQPGNVPAP